MNLVLTKTRLRIIWNLEESDLFKVHMCMCAHTHTPVFEKGSHVAQASFELTV